MKFEMPQSPEAQILMHSEWLNRVQSAIGKVTAYQDQLLPELQKHETLMESLRAAQPKGPDTKRQIAQVARLRQTRKELRRQELCLKDQERRLQERILSRQTGS